MMCRPIVLQEWNNFHKDQPLTQKKLFDAETNKKVSDWYMNERIPQMLKALKIPDTLRARLISYNAGVSYLKNKKSLPKETVNYLKKYGIAD